MLTRILLLALLLCAACGSPETRDAPAEDRVVISVIGTNDVHGQLLPHRGRGGLVTLSGYVDALRSARREDGGAVLLIDAGDMWQGTLESNISEGQAVLEVYEAMGYAAAAIGNHEFDYGRDVLMERAASASFPFLAANLVDADTGQVVDWDNVSSSVMLDVEGIRVGVVGVMTRYALYTTKAEHTRGLNVTPLVEAIVREARKLRADGAQLVIVSAHAGGKCEDFTDPTDTSTCNPDSEIMRVAQALPAGLVDHILAGHVHEKIAHILNGVSITSAASSTRAFGRVDFTLRRSSGEIVERKVFPPQLPCPAFVPGERACAWTAADATPARYQGLSVTPNPAVSAIAGAAFAAAAERKQQPVGISLDHPFTLDGNPESPLARLFTDAMLDRIDGDVAIHNVTGGIRTSLPAGEMTFGSVYEMFPFDNRIVVLELSGAQLRKIIAGQAHNHARRAGFAGMHVSIGCSGDTLQVEMTRDDGVAIRDEESVRVITNDFLALGGDGIFTPVMPDGGFPVASDLPMVRDVLLDWLRSQGPSLELHDFADGGRTMWSFQGQGSLACRYGT